MFTDATQWLLETLSGTTNAALDPADLNLPGVWIVPGTITLDRLDATTGTVEMHLYLIGSGAGPVQDLHTLDDLARRVATTLHLHNMDAVTVTLPNHSAGPLPAYHSTINLEYKE